jgi:hypothetical protein
VNGFSYFIIDHSLLEKMSKTEHDVPKHVCDPMQQSSEICKGFAILFTQRATSEKKILLVLKALRHNLTL